MLGMDAHPILSAKDVAAIFADPVTAAKYPLLLTPDEAALLARVSKQTLYGWSSQGLLKGCSRKVGKHLRILRDKFFLKIINEGLHGN
jgi:hypothetical protein